MTFEAKPLPLLEWQDRTTIDVWPLDGGVGLTISDPDGTIHAGVYISRSQWLNMCGLINDKLKGDT